MISCVDRLMVIQSEIDILKSRLQPHDTGHIHTAISVLSDRLEEVSSNIKQKLDPETLSGTLGKIADG